MQLRQFWHPRVWLAPVLMIVILSLALPFCYLAGITDPQSNLHRLPVALVVGEQVPGGLPGAAETVAAAVRTRTDQRKIGLVPLSSADMDRAFHDNTIYAAVVIPPGFERGLSDLVDPQAGAVSARPDVTIRTNAGDGNLAAGLATANILPVLTAAQREVGARLLAAAGPGATPQLALLLQEPFAVHTVPDHPLPAKAGSGLTPFYLALVTILIGFIGASTVHPTVDAAIGFVPSEFGPLTSRRPYRWASRTTTLLAKFTVLLLVAPTAAALLQWVATVVIGIPVQDPVALWLLFAAAIAAVGLGALSVFAVFGSPGALLNTFFFVALSLATGPSVPVEALPAWLRAVTSVTPMQPVFDGVRAILFFDGRGAAGLDHAWIRIAIGAATGVALGLLTMLFYDRHPRLSRHPTPHRSDGVPGQLTTVTP